jgi:catechol 2,3-dioxygenase-like lactoylglutathione lyase family enzyme
VLGDTDALAMLAVRDLAAARAFYEGALGLHPLPDQEPGVQVLTTGRTRICLYESRYAGTNQANALAWDVGSRLESLVAALKAKGVAFEHYDDLPGITREGDIHIAGPWKGAWFKDPDGNILHILNR